MPILREITALLRLKLDKRSFDEADRRVKGLSGALSKFGTLAGGAALLAGGAGLLKFVQLGSDANETLNLLNASFKENASEVTDWAATFAGAANRSEFELREMAGTLGAVLNPLMDENTEVAARMSTQMAQLAVDLGSFFNVSDTDAINALRSGIVGETEAIKRLGVVMLDTTLEAFRLEQGITKQFKAMTIAEKTALRYEFILDQTKIAQGDAVRTAEGWANATKGLSSAFKDLGTRIGLTLIPFAEKLVIGTRNAVRAFLEWQKGTKLLKAGLIVLGTVGVAIATALLIAWAPVIAPILAFVAAVTVAALILDDFLVLMDGGDSVIGRFINKIWGPGSAGQAVIFLKDVWEGMVLFWNQGVIPAIEGVGFIFEKIAKSIGDTWNEVFKNLAIGFDGIVSTAKKAAKFLGLPTSTDPANRPQTRGRFRAVGGERRFVPNANIPVPASVAAGAGNGATVSNSVTVQVQGNATANDAARIGDAAGEAQRRVNRKTQAALVQRTEG